MEPFYIVIDGTQARTQVSKRLCRENNRHFIVLKAITLVKPAPVPVEVVTIGDDDAE